MSFLHIPPTVLLLIKAGAATPTSTVACCRNPLLCDSCHQPAWHSTLRSCQQQSRTRPRERERGKKPGMSILQGMSKLLTAGASLQSLSQNRNYSRRTSHEYEMRGVFFRNAIMRMCTDYSRAPSPAKTLIRTPWVEVKKMFGLQIPKQPADVRSKQLNN